MSLMVLTGAVTGPDRKTKQKKQRRNTGHCPQMAVSDRSKITVGVSWSMASYTEHPDSGYQLFWGGRVRDKDQGSM